MPPRPRSAPPRLRSKSAKASILAARAVLEKAELDLGFTKIVSPVDGIAGIAKAQIGNLVGPGSIEELTMVSTVDPIKVYVPDERTGLPEIRAEWTRPADAARSGSCGWKHPSRTKGPLPLRTDRWM